MDSRPDAPGAEVLRNIPGELGDVFVNGNRVRGIIQDTSGTPDVENGATSATLCHIIGKETGQGEDGVQSRTERGGVVLQNAPGGGGVVATKVGVAYYHVDALVAFADDRSVQGFGGRGSRRQVGGVGRHVDRAAGMLVAQLGGEAARVAAEG